MATVGGAWPIPFDPPAEQNSEHSKQHYKKRLLRENPETLFADYTLIRDKNTISDLSQGSLCVGLQVQTPELTRYKSVVLPLNRQLTHCS